MRMNGKRNTGKIRNYLQVCSLRPRDPMPTYPLQGIRATVVRLNMFYVLCLLVEQRLKSHSTMLDLWRLTRLIMEWIQHVLKNVTRARDRREFERFEEIPKARETRVTLWFVSFRSWELTPEWNPKAREIQALERSLKQGTFKLPFPF